MAALITISSIIILVLALFIYWLMYLKAGNVDKLTAQLKKEESERLNKRNENDRKNSLSHIRPHFKGAGDANDFKEILVGRFKSA